MKSIGNIAAAVQDRIRVKRKAPQKAQVDSYTAVRSTCSPLAVLPAQIFDSLDILRDASALAVFIAICNHANKSGITSCSQERIAALTRLSRKTIGRKVKKLCDMGLLKIEYRRPYAGTARRLNIMRVIYGNATMSRQDVASIAQPTGQHHVPQVNKLSTGQDGANIATPDKTASPMGQQEVPQVDHMAILGHVSDPPMGQMGTPTYGTTDMSQKLAKALNNRDILEAINKALIRFSQKPIEFTDSDLATINGTAITERDITGAVADYLLECQDAKRKPAPSLPAILGNLLTAH
jgi:hypothetical protein